MATKYFFFPGYFSRPTSTDIWNQQPDGGRFGLQVTPAKTNKSTNTAIRTFHISVVSKLARATTGRVVRVTPSVGVTMSTMGVAMTATVTMAMAECQDAYQVHQEPYDRDRLQTQRGEVGRT